MLIGHRRNRTITLAAGLALLLMPGAVWSQELFGSRVNGLMSFDFSDNYITPRGLHVEDEGLVAQPLLLLFWKLHAADRGAVSDVTLTTGVWNSFHSTPAGYNPSRWNEIDPILGLTVKFRNGLAFDASATAFYTPTDSYATSGHGELKLTYNDSFKSGFALNPWVAYWRELNDKAPVVFDPETSSRGWYVTAGATPTLGLAGGASLDVGTYVNFVSSDFYQRFDGSDGGSGAAVFSVAPKVSVPVKFLGVTHGGWTAYAGFSYYHLRNEGLLDGNQALDGSAERKPNLSRFRAGLSVFF
jgi:hypothetical protein